SPCVKWKILLVCRLNATDKDEGANADITFSFSHIPEKALKIFSLDSKSGVIKIKGALDFEVTRNYEITVEAKDGGGFATRCTVLIQIVDVNDNSPEIMIKSLFTPIPENSLAGTLIALINVNDQDSGSNGEVNCHLPEKSPFKLISSSNNYYQLITTSLLDRETTPMYNITITAEDEGSPPMSSKKTIYLALSDVNDNPPVFQKPSYIVYIPENNTPGSSIHRVQASDIDDGKNSELEYSLVSSNISNIPISSYVSINVKSGVIYSQRLFDYEDLREFQFQVVAKDRGQPSLNNNVTVRICIIDMNDNAPKILYPVAESEGTTIFEFIPRSSEKGYLVTKVIAVDADSGHNAWLSYHLLEIPDTSLFVIGQHTGEIKIGRDLQDMDSLRQKVVVLTTPMYDITITAEDEGSPPMSSKKTIYLPLSDVNDNPPVFQKPSYIVYIPENNTPGSSIHRVQASDIDDGKNSELEYSLVSSNISNIPISSYVSINVKSGVIYSQRLFDYEELREFQFQVVAKDRGQPSLNNNVTVRICIIDMNDNAPKILYPIGETEEIPDTSLFVIGQHTGEIKIGRDLQDMDSLRQKVVVLVKDNGVPSLSATVTLNLVMAENFQQVLPEIVIQPKESSSSSKVTFFLVVSIAVISFLFIVTVIVTVINKCRKTNSQTALGAFNRSWYPQLSLNYPSQFSDGSLPLPYSYDVCVTLDSKQNEIAYLKPIQNVPTENLIDTSDSATGDSTQDNSAPDSLNKVK
uniref:Cadherin domain-containing protein n=1 Tax=Leptobrachium leishanense TaxID=445787 RepID=A0A8C5PGZ7_9ANUR